MAYKWKPSKTARREFAERMQNDKEFADNYYARKEKKLKKNRATSKFNYNTAGGNYIPTKSQYEFCMNNTNLFKTSEEKKAINIVIFGYTNHEKVHHDFIHVINEKIRNIKNE